MTIEQLALLYQSYISNLEHNIEGLNGNSHRRIQAETQITAYKEFVNELGQIDTPMTTDNQQKGGKQTIIIN